MQFLQHYWDILGCHPTNEIRELKRAYAKKLKQHHPEEDPKGFQKLREAYEVLRNELLEPEEKNQEHSPTEKVEAQPPSNAIEIKVDEPFEHPIFSDYLKSLHNKEDIHLRHNRLWDSLFEIYQTNKPDHARLSLKFSKYVIENTQLSDEELCNLDETFKWTETPQLLMIYKDMQRVEGILEQVRHFRFSHHEQFFSRLKELQVKSTTAAMLRHAEKFFEGTDFPSLEAEEHFDYCFVKFIVRNYTYSSYQIRGLVERIGFDRDRFSRVAPKLNQEEAESFLNLVMESANLDESSVEIDKALRHSPTEKAQEYGAFAFIAVIFFFILIANWPSSKNRTTKDYFNKTDSQIEMAQESLKSMFWMGVQNSNPVMVRLAVRRGYEVQTCDIDNKNAMHHAIRNDNLGFAEELLALGLDPTFTCLDGPSPFEVVVADNNEPFINLFKENPIERRLKTKTISGN